MGPFLQKSLLTLLVGTLLLGRCLPCANLPASSENSKSCCNKAGECQRVPSNSSNPKPCPLQQSAIATVDTVLHHDTTTHLVSSEPLVATPITLQVSLKTRPHATTDSPPYPSPNLFLLNSAFLI